LNPSDPGGKAAALGLSFPFTPAGGGLPGPVFAANDAALRAAALSPLSLLRPLPGLGAWSLDCRRKTLRGVLRGWLLKSRKPVR
jgi:hypothetical protein